jgi:uncharacterized protein (DUF58 family)
MAQTAAPDQRRGLRSTWQRLMERWLRRRAPIHPPLTLAYRQIFILPTRFGWMLGLLMGAMLIGSLNFNNNLGLLTTFIVAGLAVNSMLAAFRNLHRLTIRGGMARPVFAGQPASYQLSLQSADQRPRASVCLRHERNLVGIDIEDANTISVTVSLVTWRRGWYRPGRMCIETTHPLGLFRAWAWFWPDRPYLVWPQPADRPPPLPESGGSPGGADQRRPVDGEDFHSLRQWREGDPLHRIAWKASQRHQDLLSREFREEQSPELVLALDQAPARDLESRISIVTAWVVQAEQQNRVWTLKLGSTELGPDQGPAHRKRCLRALAEL